VDTLEYGPEVHEWFSRVLGVSCRLVRSTKARPSTGETAPVSTMSLANESPFLLISQSSVDKIIAHLSEASVEVDASCFRGNLLVQDAPCFMEDRWRRIQIGQQVFEASTFVSTPYPTYSYAS
jgi:uncharacterized protein YcbX